MNYDDHIDIYVLTEKSGKGDEEAFKQLYLHLNDRIFSYVLSRVYTREDALDIAQHIFTDVWLAMKKFTYISDDHFYSFVFLIAKRRLGKYYRSHKRHISLEEKHMSDMYEIDLDGLSDIEMIRQCMEQLRNEYREIVELRYWSQLSFKEIGGVLKSTESAVRVKHHRAIAKLRDIIHAYE